MEDRLSRLEKTLDDLAKKAGVKLDKYRHRETLVSYLCRSGIYPSVPTEQLLAEARARMPVEQATLDYHQHLTADMQRWEERNEGIWRASELAHSKQVSQQLSQHYDGKD
jgi:hypothetical protein